MKAICPPVITTMALCQLTHLGTICTVIYIYRCIYILYIYMYIYIYKYIYIYMWHFMFMTFSFLSMIHFYVIMQMILHFILFKKATSLTSLFLCIYRNDNYTVLNLGKMSLHDFWFEWFCSWRWHNFFFSRRTCGIRDNNWLNFYSHLKQLCKKSGNKLNILTRIAP